VISNGVRGGLGKRVGTNRIDVGHCGGLRIKGQGVLQHGYEARLCRLAVYGGRDRMNRSGQV